MNHLENPRVEAEEHYFNPTHTKLLDLGLKPKLLSDVLVESMITAVAEYSDRIDRASIAPVTTWR